MSSIKSKLSVKTLSVVWIGCLCCLAGCVTRIEHRGCYIQSFDLKDIKEHVDNKKSVEAKWGQPSTTSVFGEHRWYYIHREIANSPARGKKTVLHKSIVLTFDAQGFVIQKEEILGENKVSFCKDVTKERGYKTSFLKETFRNIGKFSQSGGVNK